MVVIIQMFYFHEIGIMVLVLKSSVVKMFLIIWATLYVSVWKTSLVKMFLHCQLILATLNSSTKVSGVTRLFHIHLQVLGQCDQQGQHPPTHPPPPLPPHRQW